MLIKFKVNQLSYIDFNSYKSAREFVLIKLKENQLSDIDFNSHKLNCHRISVNYERTAHKQTDKH